MLSYHFQASTRKHLSFRIRDVSRRAFKYGNVCSFRLFLSLCCGLYHFDYHFLSHLVSLLLARSEYGTSIQLIVATLIGVSLKSRTLSVFRVRITIHGLLILQSPLTIHRQDPNGVPPRPNAPEVPFGDGDLGQIAMT